MDAFCLTLEGDGMYLPETRVYLVNHLFLAQKPRESPWFFIRFMEAIANLLNQPSIVGMDNVYPHCWRGLFLLLQSRGCFATRL